MIATEHILPYLFELNNEVSLFLKIKFDFSREQDWLCHLDFMADKFNNFTERT